MTRPRLLDLFCGAGGSAVGYHRVGFDVVGVDHVAQPNYPFDFIQADALEFLREWVADSACWWTLLSHLHFDAIHASPPCQVHSAAKRIVNSAVRPRTGHVDLVDATRKLLIQTGRPWVIENVPGAPLNRPVQLCGTHFGLPLRRHRLFESSVFLFAPGNLCRHEDGDFTVFGHAVQLCGSHGTPYSDAQGRTHYRQKRMSLREGQEAMGIGWMNRAELSQAIPPAYTQFLGKQLLAAVESCP